MGQVALEGLLVAPGPGAPPEDLQQYLQLLAEAYRRTHALAAQLQPIAGPECNTAVQHSCHPSCPALPRTFCVLCNAKLSCCWVVLAAGCSRLHAQG